MTGELAMSLMTSQQVMKHDCSCLAQSQTTLALFVCWYHCNTLEPAALQPGEGLCLILPTTQLIKKITTVFYNSCLFIKYFNPELHSELTSRKN